MATDSVVRARIDAQVKEKATAVLGEMGLSVSAAIRLMLAHVSAEKALPFEVRVPNAKTEAAFRVRHHRGPRAMERTAAVGRHSGRRPA